MKPFELLYFFVQSMPNSKRKKTKLAETPVVQNDITNGNSETAIDQDRDEKVRLYVLIRNMYILGRWFYCY